MTDYIKSTNFTAKDSLVTGDAGKIVKGSEIDNELVAIASAVSTKANSNNADLTGTPVAPTASSGTNSTQIATTAFVTTAIANENLGTMATQNSDAIAVTGGTMSGVTITTSTVEGHTVGSNATGTKTISTASPSGGSNGDIWYKVS